MNSYEKEKLEKSAKELSKIESEMNSWITAIKRVQGECEIIRQRIYNSINQEKLNDQQG